MSGSWLTMPERLTGLYLQAGYTREGFASAVKMSPESIERWERFEEVPTLIELGELANGLHVSKRTLCFGEDNRQVGKRGEPQLTEVGIQVALADVGASESEQYGFQSYRARVSNDWECSRTFVLAFVRAWRSAIEGGADDKTAMERAMVIATQAHYLSRAVAQGLRPVREHQFTQPLKSLSSEAQAEHIAAEIHRLSGITPPIEPHVLAVAMGLRLVPTFDSSKLEPN
jgi:transcriptional regulator with XRE-family HTH domain